MSRILGFTFFLLLLAALAFITLKDMKPIADSSADTPITGTDWKPVSIGDQVVADDAKLQLRFEVDGKLNGSGGCNSFFGNYVLTESGIDIGPIGATRKACPQPQMDLESRFFLALENAERVKSHGNRLILSDLAGVELAVFVEGPATSADNP